MAVRALDGADTLVYGGMDYSAPDSGGKRMGVDLLDTRTWNRRSLDYERDAPRWGSRLVLTWDSW